jgi:hypothetical protein
MTGIPQRDLKLFLEAVKEAMANPAVVERMLRVCERNEAAVARFQQEQGDLHLARQEHGRELARMSREHEERLARERAAFDAEVARRRLALEVDEAEAGRLRELAQRAVAAAEWPRASVG